MIMLYSKYFNTHVAPSVCDIINYGKCIFFMELYKLSNVLFILLCNTYELRE